MSASKKTTDKKSSRATTTRSSKTPATNKRNLLPLLATISTVLCIAFSGLLFLSFLGNAKKACASTFSKSYDETRGNVFNQFKQKAFDYYEAKNHVSNRVTLSIKNIKKENALEVLSVSETYLKTSDPDKDEDRTTRWVEFTGTAVYTVDMTTSEFIIDDNNKFILVKLKTPQLNQPSLNNNPKVYLYKYKKGVFKVNGNYDTGVKQMLQDRAEAQEEITKLLEINESNLAKAKESAESIIRNLIKTLNPDSGLEDSNIRIEFV